MDLTKLNFNDIYAEITRQFAEASSQFQQDFNRFQKRIDWQDPFIIGLYSTQVLFLILVLHMIRNRSNNGLMIFLTLSSKYKAVFLSYSNQNFSPNRIGCRKHQ